MWPRRGPGLLTRPAKKGDGCRGGRRRQDGLRHRGKRRRRGGWAVGGKAPRPPPQPRVEGGKPIKAQGSAQTGVLHQTRTTRDVSGAQGSAPIRGFVKRADQACARRSGPCAAQPVGHDTQELRRSALRKGLVVVAALRGLNAAGAPFRARAAFQSGERGLHPDSSVFEAVKGAA